jgi:hypothetical protein
LFCFVFLFLFCLNYLLVFWGEGAVWQQVQINFIFTANIRLLCLSYKVKKSKTIEWKLKKPSCYIGFYGVLYHIRANKNTVSIRRSTWIWYKKKR